MILGVGVHVSIKGFSGFLGLNCDGLMTCPGCTPPHAQ